MAHRATPASIACPSLSTPQAPFPSGGEDHTLQGPLQGQSKTGLGQTAQTSLLFGLLTFPVLISLLPYWLLLGALP